MSLKIYIDLDGVLADFDGHYERSFGYKSSIVDDNVEWGLVKAQTGFFAELEPTKDAFVLWDAIKHLSPTILSGVPTQIPEAAVDKKIWVERFFGPEVEMVFLPSKEKSFYSSPGSLMIDDWDKYKSLWVAKGGTWVSHKSASETIQTLTDLGVL